MNESNELWNDDKLLGLVEQQQDELEQKEQQIQELLLIKQELESALQTQSRKIADQSEQIEMLNESDQQMQNAQKLKRQSEEQYRLALAAQHTAETATWNYKAKEREAEQLIANTKKEIDSAAEEKIRRYKYQLMERSNAKIQYYANEYARRFNKYKTILFLLFLYSLTATIMEIATTEACVRHLDLFSSNISSLMNGFGDALEDMLSPLEASNLANMILEVIIRLIGLILVLGTFGVVMLGVPFGIGYLYYRTIFINANRFFHDMGLIIAVLSCVLLIWGCEYLPNSMQISAVWIWILIQLIVACGIWWYQQKNDW